MPVDFKLDPATNDLDINLKDVSYTDSVDSLTRQRIAITIKAWVGEWFFDTTFGTPYRQSILIKGVTKAEVDSIFISIINSFDDVLEVISYSSEFSRIDRRYECEFEIRTVEGDASFRAKTVTVDDTIYPTPIDIPNNLCTKAEISFEQSSEFYELINIDIPVSFPWG